MRGIPMLLLFVQTMKWDFPFVQLLVKPDWQKRWHCSSRSTTHGENLDLLQLFVASDKDAHSVEKDNCMLCYFHLCYHYKILRCGSLLFQDMLILVF